MCAHNIYAHLKPCSSTLKHIISLGYQTVCNFLGCSQLQLEWYIISQSTQASSWYSYALIKLFCSKHISLVFFLWIYAFRNNQVRKLRSDWSFLSLYWPSQGEWSWILAKILTIEFVNIVFIITILGEDLSLVISD